MVAQLEEREPYLLDDDRSADNELILNLSASYSEHFCFPLPQSTERALKAAIVEIEFVKVHGELSHKADVVERMLADQLALVKERKVHA